MSLILLSLARAWADTSHFLGPVVLSDTDELYPTMLRDGDLDGDGSRDLVYSMALPVGGHENDFPFVLRAARNDGSGSFTTTETALTYTSGDRMALAVGDVDGDGNDDVALVHSGGVAVLGSNGAGGFSVLDEVAGAWASAVALGDLDQDGDLDLAATQGHEGLRLWANDGTGSFGVMQVVPVTGLADTAGPDNTDLEIVDLDGDGAAEVIVHLPWLVGGSTPSVQVFGGVSTGGVDASTAHGLDMGTWGDPDRLRVGDLDGDGVPELVYLVGDQLVSATFDGTALSAAWVSLPPTSDGWRNNFSFGQVDGAGAAEVFATPDDFGFEVFQQDESTSFQRVDHGALANVSSVIVAHDMFRAVDLNGDGAVDLVGYDWEAGVVGLFALPTAFGVVEDGGDTGGDTGLDDTGVVDTGEAGGPMGSARSPLGSGEEVSTGCATVGSSSAGWLAAAVGLTLGLRRRRVRLDG